MIQIYGVGGRSSNWDRLNEITARLAKKDDSLWGAAAQSEASIRLDWIDLPETSRDLLPVLDALSAWSREIGHTHFILCGMGGSSLAPEVIATHYKKPLIILDSTQPDQVHDALKTDLSKCCIIVASKSGSTIETSSQKALFQSALSEAGLDPKNHLVVITDPESPLHKSAAEDGLKVVTANPKVGGRFSALSAFGLTPAALIGVDVSVLLDDALEAARTFTDQDSAVVALASLLAQPEFAFPKFYDRDSSMPGIADWIEQLVAESTGKDGRGVLPVVLTNFPDSKADVITFNSGDPLSVVGPLGAQFIFWEWVTALLCYLLEVDPFNQPNVAESKERTGKILSNWRDDLANPVYQDENLEIYASKKLDSIESYLGEMGSGKYLSIMAYLNRNSGESIIGLRDALEKTLGVPTTFGWGPRFLHSTGQFHKGGPLVGSFIQITRSTDLTIPIPGSSYGFERLVLAQALGDFEALAARNLPVIRIHLKDESAGIALLLDVASKLTSKK